MKNTPIKDLELDYTERTAIFHLENGTNLYYPLSKEFTMSELDFADDPDLTNEID